MSNKSVVIYNAVVSNEEAIAVFSKLTGKEVIVNSASWIDCLNEKKCQMITIIDIEDKEYAKIKNRVAFKKLKAANALKNW